MNDVLFCTDTFFVANQARLRSIAPDLDYVTLNGDEPVARSDRLELRSA